MRAAWTLVIACLLGACTPQVVVHPAPGVAPRPAGVLAVYPFQFRWPEPAYRSFELGYSVALTLQATGDYAVFGPDEFEVRGERSDNVFAATNLATRLGALGVSVHEVLAVRGWAEKREQRSVRAIVDATGRSQGAAQQAQLTYLVHLELIDPLTRAQVLEVEGKAEVDPLIPATEANPAPQLTRLLSSVSARFAEALEDAAPGQALARTPGFTALWHPDALFTFEMQGLPSLQVTLAGLNPLSRDVARLGPVAFFASDAGEAELTRLAAAPGGLVVRTSEAAGLAPGDAITRVGALPATPLTLARALRSANPGDSIPLTVKREGAAMQVALPVQR